MDDRESTSALVATCADCDDTHPVGDRTMGETTTVCPHCESTSYTSDLRGDHQPPKPDNDRIADAVHDVRGVGAQTQENIIATFDNYYEFEAASERELRDIGGVGRQTAARIVSAR